MEELIGVVVVSVVGIAASKTATWGIAALQKKGVKVPTWVERFAPEIVGTVAGLGAVGAEGIVTGRSDAAA